MVECGEIESSSGATVFFIDVLFYTLSIGLASRGGPFLEV